MGKKVISDMDGVIYRGSLLVDGAQDFVNRLLDTKTPFLFLTNNSEQSGLDLQRRLEHRGIHGLQPDNFITAAMATALFLKRQKQGASVYVVGGGALANEMYNAGFSISEGHPDYVVVGKTSSLNFDMIRKAANLIRDGAKFIGTNPDMIDPVENGLEPACGTLLAAIEAASGKRPYIIGKPNALMMTIATSKLGVTPSETIMIGDRMDTDIVGGMEAGMTTCLVLSGVTSRDMLDSFPYRPDYIFNTVGEIHPDTL
jgi:NagD protein